MLRYILSMILNIKKGEESSLMGNNTARQVRIIRIIGRKKEMLVFIASSKII